MTRDLLPICLSADHLVFDANWPIQTYFQEAVDDAFKSMLSGEGMQYPSIDILGTIEKIAKEITWN